MRSVIVMLLGALVLAGVPAGSTSAETLFESGIRGKQVTQQEIAGISPDVAIMRPGGGGEVRIKSNGQLKVELEGLTPVGAIVSVFASLVCQKTVLTAPPTNEVVASTSDVPLSAGGDAEINEMITLPSVCVAPIVLIRIRLVDIGGGPIDIETLGVPPPWIAASGF